MWDLQHSCPSPFPQFLHHEKPAAPLRPPLLHRASYIEPPEELLRTSTQLLPKTRNCWQQFELCSLCIARRTSSLSDILIPRRTSSLSDTGQRDAALRHRVQLSPDTLTMQHIHSDTVARYQQDAKHLEEIMFTLPKQGGSFKIIRESVEKGIGDRWNCGELSLIVVTK